jgi:hypothetical protein
MTEPWGSLWIDVVDDEIIVFLPGSSYSVTYYKPENSPQLLARRISDQDDRRVPMTYRSFSLAPGKQQTPRRVNSGGLCE